MTEQEAAVLIGQLKEHGLEFQIGTHVSGPGGEYEHRGHIRRIEDQRDVFCAPGVDEKQAKYATLALFAQEYKLTGKKVKPEGAVSLRVDRLEQSITQLNAKFDRMLDALRSGGVQVAPSPTSAVAIPGEVTDDQLRAGLAAMDVEVNPSWGRKRLMAEANDRGLLKLLTRAELGHDSNPENRDAESPASEPGDDHDD